MRLLTTCVECGGTIEDAVGPVEMNVRDQLIVVDAVAHGRCLKCGEVYFEGNEASVMQKRGVVQFKQERGLLLGEEVKALRESLGLSQARFEKMIGAGPKTVVRWEKETVFQNRTTDTLLRVLRDYPQVAQDLMDKALN